jgi:hypothetical protein
VAGLDAAAVVVYEAQDLAQLRWEALVASVEGRVGRNFCLHG